MNTQLLDDDKAALGGLGHLLDRGDHALYANAQVPLHIVSHRDSIEPGNSSSFFAFESLTVSISAGGLTVAASLPLHNQMCNDPSMVAIQQQYDLMRQQALLPLLVHLQ